jgi:protein-S-isoprenylcysteine O-methyltransferase Ste14
MKAFKLFIKSFIGTLAFLSILFLSAGRLNYWQGWLFASVSFVSLILNSFVLADKDLAEERSTPKAGVKSWDKKIVAYLALALLITYIVAGLDAGRFGWTPQLPRSMNLLGVILILGGEAFFLAAQKQNKFFSSVVRIQEERGHAVCDTGVYKLIRHPAYFGMILTAIGIPFILGSLWSFLPSSVSILLTIVRTSLEDKTLIRELEGYLEYTNRTSYRLIPHVW